MLCFTKEMITLLQLKEGCASASPIHPLCLPCPVIPHPQWFLAFSHAEPEHLARANYQRQTRGIDVSSGKSREEFFARIQAMNQLGGWGVTNARGQAVKSPTFKRTLCFSGYHILPQKNLNVHPKNHLLWKCTYLSHKVLPL